LFGKTWMSQSSQYLHNGIATFFKNSTLREKFFIIQFRRKMNFKTKNLHVVHLRFISFENTNITTLIQVKKCFWKYFQKDVTAPMRSKSHKKFFSRYRTRLKLTTFFPKIIICTRIFREKCQIYSTLYIYLFNLKIDKTIHS
jgi:uncharacterized membrane protein